jgi:AcrR family transcriptional regulator
MVSGFGDISARSFSIKHHCIGYGGTVANMAGGVKRPYRSPRRHEQMEQTRNRVLDAATGLFVEHGWDGTSIVAIAAAAEVAPETVYARFGTKRGLLGEVVQRAVRGDDPRPVPEQKGPRAVAAATDQREQLRLFARDVVLRLERAAPLVAAVAAASHSEPELGELYERLHADRVRNLGVLVDLLAANGPLRLPRTQAVDTVWALTSPELHQALTRIRGWSRRRYVAWLDDTLTAQLLPDRTSARRGGPLE